MTIQQSDNSMTLFNFNATEVRVITIDNAPWFVAKDLCNVLELSEVSKTVERLDDDEKLIRTLFVSGQNRDMVCVSESGMYSLVLTSRKQQAKLFKKWVTSEVIPSIRKTGSYQLAPKSTADMLILFADAFKQHETRLSAIEQENIELRAQLKEQAHLIEAVAMEGEANTVELERFRNGHGYYYSIAGYCNNKGIKQSLQWMSAQGRKASALCKQRGIVPVKINDPRFGNVGTYPDTILDELTWD